MAEDLREVSQPCFLWKQDCCFTICLSGGGFAQIYLLKLDNMLFVLIFITRLLPWDVLLLWPDSNRILLHNLLHTAVDKLVEGIELLSDQAFILEKG